MKATQFEYEGTCQITNAEIDTLCKKLLPEIERIKSAYTDSTYSTDYASVYLPLDTEMVQQITAVAKEKKSLNPTILVVIGIGGSNLGTIAVLEALRGAFYNKGQDCAVYFADTVDSDNINDIAQHVEHELETGNNIILNVVSKSGTTTESIANFEIFLKILKNHRPYNYQQFVVATTDRDSALAKLAQKEEFALLTIPDRVGGRYSVFSAVGLFPLCFLNIDCKQLLAGAQSGFEIGTTKIDSNDAAISAAIIMHHYSHGSLIHDTFLFSVALTNVGAWYRQLSAESIGKSHTRTNELINVGILPTISIGSTDLHSVAQLYLAGPHNRFTSFIEVAHNATNLVLPNYQEFESLVANIQTKSLASIMNAILEGTKKAYFKDTRPFVSWTLPEKSAFYVGQFMQIKMIEMMYLGYLLNVNPFDQPEVEKYKTETRNILELIPKIN